MLKSVEFCQLVSRAISHTTWNIPRIRDGDRWRNIENAHLVENPTHVNGYDHFEDAIFRAKDIMEALEVLGKDRVGSRVNVCITRSLVQHL